jgi:hypothetical protein
MTEAIGNSFIPRRAKYYYNEMVYAAALSSDHSNIVESVFILAHLGVIRNNLFNGTWLHAK